MSQYILSCVWGVLVFYFGYISANTDGLVNLTFPSSFKFGVASSAYQIEGSWNVDGKSQNIWDFWSHTYPFMFNNETGDVACDSYNKYKEDVQMLKELGVDYYRFSISWSRILPTGFANEVNEAGIQYYQNLLDELEHAGIEPMVTIFHFDLPMSLFLLGNMHNPNMAEYYAAYADIAFKYFGNRVKLWTTFNEPTVYCEMIYDMFFNQYFDYYPLGFMEYSCGHNLIRAHAEAYRLYERKYKASQGGKISLNLMAFWNEPASKSPEDIEAADRKNAFDFGWFAHPIFLGNYPQLMIDNVARISHLQGFPKSRLPEFTPKEIDYIRGTCDFVALNFYSAYLVEPNYYENQYSSVTKPSFLSDQEAFYFQDPSWPGSNGIFKIVPWALRKQLKYIKENYNNPEIIITENGNGDDGSALNDSTRISFIQDHLNQILLAIQEDNVNVTGYTHWSLMDSFEWFSGYSSGMGLYHVDFTSENRTRTAKQSVSYYNRVIRNRCLLDVCNGPEAGSDYRGYRGWMVSRRGVEEVNDQYCL